MLPVQALHWCLFDLIQQGAAGKRTRSIRKKLFLQHGQRTIGETRACDFRKELEDKEREGRPAKRLKLDTVHAASVDADDSLDENSGSSDDDDDTEALLAEMNKIKKERAVEQSKKEIARRQEEGRIRMENILRENPLLTRYSSGSTKVDQRVKRSWDDDVVFKNCAKSEPKKNNGMFINDTLRSGFHKKFMEKYVE
ncbi:protein CWC15 homolog A-like [Leptinotarsa decemlineata]|uniref:protein CWC15 homolog A-like n=1 Tax=Leptinotarsa decemlineata TaxID=7539 RepID=UPI003D307A01